MDMQKATTIVFSRIQKLDPENVSKIVGYLLLQDVGEKEMIRLAFCPDNHILSLVTKAKSFLSSRGKSESPAQVSLHSFPQSHGSDLLPMQFTPYLYSVLRSSSSPASFPAVSSCWEPPHLSDQKRIIPNLDYYAPSYTDSFVDGHDLRNHNQFLNLEDRIDPIPASSPEISNQKAYSESTLRSLSSRVRRRSPSLPEFPTFKTCLYHARGYCKHGSNCRFSHSHSMPGNFAQILNVSPSDISTEEQFFSPGNVERLEMDLTQLLRAKHSPVSIASLPQLYYERYGRTLQAEGYLTESQRHGKSGHSLTKLLARMKSIAIIERPHGQHVVVLAEDAPRNIDLRSERNDLGLIVPGSRQIYLTFPADSTFTEEDVSNYFSTYGPVQDVRIPCQQKRMFGFVSFVYAETVRLIFSKGNPHFVCGARVLVKPYREKTRKYHDRIDSPICCPSHLLELDPEYHSGICERSCFLRKQLIEGDEKELNIERQRFLGFHLDTKPLIDYLGCERENLKHPEELFGYLPDDDVTANYGCGNEDRSNLTNGSCYNDKESVDISERPLASPVTKSIPISIRKMEMQMT